MGVRLKGVVFEIDFDGDDYEAHIKTHMHKVYEHPISANQREKKDREDLGKELELKSLYAQERYAAD